MSELIEAAVTFLLAGGQFLLTLARTLVPVLPLIAWTAFWYFAVDWRKLSPTIRGGGWLAIALIAVLGITVAAAVQTSDQPRQIGPLTVSPLAEAIGWTLLLLATMFYAGAAQLSRRPLRRS